jgi:hypothetical protein
MLSQILIFLIPIFILLISLKWPGLGRGILAIAFILSSVLLFAYGSNGNLKSIFTEINYDENTSSFNFWGVLIPFVWMGYACLGTGFALLAWGMMTKMAAIIAMLLILLVASALPLMQSIPFLFLMISAYLIWKKNFEHNFFQGLLLRFKSS